MCCGRTLRRYLERLGTPGARSAGCAGRSAGQDGRRDDPAVRARRAPDPHRRGAPRGGRVPAGADARRRGGAARGAGPGARGGVVAAVALPPFDNSAMDGYAVRAAEVAGATRTPVTLPVAFDIPAGRTDVPVLEPGAAQRIMTGAPVPAGADAIVPVEQTDGGYRPRARDPAPAVGTPCGGRGRTSRRATSCSPRARCWARRRSAWRPRSVRPRCRCAAVRWCWCCPRAPSWSRPARRCSTARSTSRTGRCSPPRSRTRAAGGAPAVRPGRRRAVPRRARRAGGGVDLVLTSGGVSAGAYEVVKDALAGRGVTFGKVAMQPGGPQGAGGSDGGGRRHAAGQPGERAGVVRGVRAARAARRARATRIPSGPSPRSLAQRLTSPSGRRQFRRGVLDAAGARSPRSAGRRRTCSGRWRGPTA